MKTLSMRELQRNAGNLDSTEPIAIQKHKKTYFVLIPVEQYADYLEQVKFDARSLREENFKYKEIFRHSLFVKNPFSGKYQQLNLDQALEQADQPWEEHTQFIPDPQVKNEKASMTLEELKASGKFGIIDLSNHD
jgi:hypothetical protein